MGLTNLLLSTKDHFIAAIMLNLGDAVADVVSLFVKLVINGVLPALLQFPIVVDKPVAARSSVLLVLVQ